MTDLPDALALADELAEIARATTDPITGVRLMELVKQLLERAGLSPEEDGGGEWLAPWVSEAARQPA